MAVLANVQRKLVSSSAIFRVARKKSFASASKTRKQSSVIAQDRKAGLHLPQISCCRHTLTWWRKFRSFFLSAMLYLKSTNLRLCGWTTPIFRNGNISKAHYIKRQALKKLSLKCRNIIACFARSQSPITIMWFRNPKTAAILLGTSLAYAQSITTLYIRILLGKRSLPKRKPDLTKIWCFECIKSNHSGTDERVEFSFPEAFLCDQWQKYLRLSCSARGK